MNKANPIVVFLVGITAGVVLGILLDRAIAPSRSTTAAAREQGGAFREMHDTLVDRDRG